MGKATIIFEKAAQLPWSKRPEGEVIVLDGPQCRGVVHINPYGDVRNGSATEGDHKLADMVLASVNEHEKLVAALKAIHDWYHEAPIAEMNAVEDAIERRFPLAIISEALARAGRCSGCGRASTLCQCFPVEDHEL